MGRFWSQLTLANIAGAGEFISCSKNTYRNSALRLFLILFLASATAAIFSPFGLIYADELSAERPARQAQCILEVEGILYVHGGCLFVPLDREGSFQITGPKRVSASVKVKSPGIAVASWSGPAGGDAAAASLGRAYTNHSGCWVVDLSSTEDTAVCAWDKKQRLFLGSARPVDPNPPKLAWGERAGMFAQILSSAGLGTANATVTAVKDRDGAIGWCRLNFDYSMKCIEETLSDTGLAPRKVTLHANCKTKRFTDFWGRNLEALDGDILNLDTNEKLGSSTAAGSMVASTAFNTLCPERTK